MDNIEEKVLSYLVVLDDFEETIESFKSLKDDLSDIYDKNDSEEKVEEQEVEETEEETDSSTNAKEQIAKKLNTATEKTQEAVKKAQEEYAKASKSLTVILERVVRVGELVKKLTDMGTYLEQIQKVISELTEEALNNPYVQYLILQVELLALKIKKELVICSKKINKYTAKYLSLFINGKCCAALATTYGALIMALQAVASSVQVALDALQKVIDCIPPNFAVDGEGLSFFITPKYFSGGINIPIYNMNSSLINYLADALNDALSELIHTPTKLNVPLKSAYIGAKVAASQAALSVGGVNIPLPEINVQSASNIIYKSADLIMALFPSPNPLPKYEKLNMLTNIGFSMWLITGWCRAGQVAFGLPGQLPGIPG